MTNKELNMMNYSLVTSLFLATAVTTSSNSVSVRANTVEESHLIAQSRRQYECSRNGVEPSISGAILRDGNCFYLYRQENVLPIQILGVLAILLQVVLQAWPSAIILQLPMMKLQGGSTTNSFLALSLYSSSI